MHSYELDDLIRYQTLIRETVWGYRFDFEEARFIRANNEGDNRELPKIAEQLLTTKKRFRDLYDQDFRRVALHFARRYKDEASGIEFEADTPPHLLFKESSALFDAFHYDSLSSFVDTVPGPLIENFEHFNERAHRFVARELWSHHFASFVDEIVKDPLYLNVEKGIVGSKEGLRRKYDTNSAQLLEANYIGRFNALRYAFVLLYNHGGGWARERIPPTSFHRAGATTSTHRIVYIGAYPEINDIAFDIPLSDILNMEAITFNRTRKRIAGEKLPFTTWSMRARDAILRMETGNYSNSNHDVQMDFLRRPLGTVTSLSAASSSDVDSRRRNGKRMRPGRPRKLQKCEATA